MKITLGVASLAFLLSAGGANAGCLTGAAVGAVAGHMAHHGVLGAAAGCAVGHHMKKNAQQRDQQNAYSTNDNRVPADNGNQNPQRY